MQCKDIPDELILKFLSEYQGQWTCLWYGKLEGVVDLYYAFPTGTPEKLIRSKMKKLHKKGLVGGCPCGCRGDFEITDKGLAFIGAKRTAKYSGY